ncbi:MAG: GNAT family N-acetyltransferase [Gemmatimonadota bacterium]
MSDPVTLRRATAEDLDELVALWSHYIREHQNDSAYRRLPPDALEKRREVFARRLEDPDCAIFVLARPDGGLDGMITCFVEENEPYFLPRCYARLQVPFVRPDARRRGRLRMLLEAAFRWAREQEMTELRLYTGADNLPANTLAEELGFQAIEVVRRHTLDWRRPPESQVEGDSRW